MATKRNPGIGLFEEDVDGESCDLGEGLCIGQTDDALLVAMEDETLHNSKDGEGLWIPKSVIHNLSEVYSPINGEDEGKVLVAQWWAEKNGMA